MSGDTYENTFQFGSFSVTYTANASPSWFGAYNLDNSFLWYASWGSNSDSGTFNPDPIDSLICGYGSTGGDYGDTLYRTDHVYIHLTDSIDEADGTANYYMRLHHNLEDVQTLTDITNTGDWTRVSNYTQRGSATGPVSVATNSSISFDDSAVGSPSDLSGVIIFEVLELPWPYLGSSYATSVGDVVSGDVSAGMWYWVERRARYRHRAGTIDHYGSRGYLGLYNWTAGTAITETSPNSSGICPLVDYDTRLQTSDTCPPN